MFKNNSVLSQSAQDIVAHTQKSLRGIQGVSVSANKRSVWVSAPKAADAILKSLGYKYATSKDAWWFTYADATPASAPAPVKPAQTAPVAKPKADATPKPEKVYEELPDAVKAHVRTQMARKYPGTQIEIRGSWVFIAGEKTRDYKDALKADGFHWGFKAKAWSRALTPAECALKAEPAQKPAPAPVKPAQTEPAHDAEAIDELQKLSEIVIRARKGEMSRDEMIAAMKEVCPF